MNAQGNGKKYSGRPSVIRNNGEIEVNKKGKFEDACLKKLTRRSNENEIKTNNYKRIDRNKYSMNRVWIILSCASSSPCHHGVKRTRKKNLRRISRQKFDDKTWSGNFFLNNFISTNFMCKKNQKKPITKRRRRWWWRHNKGRLSEESVFTTSLHPGRTKNYFHFSFCCRRACHRFNAMYVLCFGHTQIRFVMIIIIFWVLSIVPCTVLSDYMLLPYNLHIEIKVQH